MITNYFKDMDNLVIFFEDNTKWKKRVATENPHVFLFKSPHGKILGIDIEHIQQFLKDNKKPTPKLPFYTPTYGKGV